MHLNIKTYIVSNKCFELNKNYDYTKYKINIKY